MTVAGAARGQPQQQPGVVLRVVCDPSPSVTPRSGPSALVNGDEEPEAIIVDTMDHGVRMALERGKPVRDQGWSSRDQTRSRQCLAACTKSLSVVSRVRS